MKRVLVTGASGFVGTAVCRHLASAGVEVLGTVRQQLPVAERLEGVIYVETGDIRAFSEWGSLVSRCSAIVHLAARVHVMKESAVDSLREFRLMNVDATAGLADAAEKAGIRNFVFLSTIGVLGDVTEENRPFSESSLPRPHNFYCRSKLEAEQLLTDTLRYPSLAATVIRPPLVYGAGNPGNFLSLLRIVAGGTPLPFALVRNRRSFVYVESLAHAIVKCVDNPKAMGRTYLVSDDEDVSTPELVRRIGAAMGRPARLLPIPPRLLRLAAALSGRTAMARRVLDSLVVDSSRIRAELGWRPPHTLEEGLKETVNWYMNEEGRKRSGR